MSNGILGHLPEPEGEQSEESKRETQRLAEWLREQVIADYMRNVWRMHVTHRNSGAENNRH